MFFHQYYPKSKPTAAAITTIITPTKIKVVGNNSFEEAASPF